MKKIIIALAFLGTCILAQAQNATPEKQDTTLINKEVEIEKDYQPELKKSKRLNVKLIPRQPEVKAKKPNYSQYISEIKLHSNSAPIQQVPLEGYKRRTPYKNYIEVAGGMPINWATEGYVELIDNRRFQLNTNFIHTGIHNPVQHYYDTDIALNGSYQWSRQTTLFGSVNYLNDIYSYNGVDSVFGFDSSYKFPNNKIYKGDQLIPENQQRNRINIIAGIMQHQGRNPWAFNAHIAYDMLHLQSNGLMENRIALVGDGKYELDFATAALDINIQTAVYNNAPNAEIPVNLKNQTLISLSPKMLKSWKNIHFQIGAHLNISTDVKPHVNLLPDLKAEYQITKWFQAYGGLTGDYQFNDMIHSFNQNPYWDPENTMTFNTVKPLDGFLGANFTPLKNLTINPYIHYAYIENNISYTNKTYYSTDVRNDIYPRPSHTLAYGNIFTAKYQDLSELNIGTKVSYDLKNTIGASADLNYYHYSSEVYHTPSFTCNMSAYGRIAEHLILSTDLKMAFGRKALFFKNTDQSYVENMDAFIEWNLRASYELGNQFALFAKGNNLLGSIGDNQKWYGYENFGPYASIGFNYKF
jgi:hypothetical protein